MADPRPLEGAEAIRSKSPDLPKSQEVQAKINGMFIEDGIGRKILRSLGKEMHEGWSALTSNLEDCNFGVRESLGLDYRTKVRSLVIDFPNPDPTKVETQPRIEIALGFGPELLRDFNPPPVPLTDTQILTVNHAFILQKEDREKASS